MPLNKEYICSTYDMLSANEFFHLDEELEA